MPKLGQSSFYFDFIKSVILEMVTLGHIKFCKLKNRRKTLHKFLDAKVTYIWGFNRNLKKSRLKNFN